MADYCCFHTDLIIRDEEASQVMFKLMDLKPHLSFGYTWDDLGMANLMHYCYSNKFCYSPEEKSWYEYQGHWTQLSFNGRLFNAYETLLKMLLLYVKEQIWLVEHDETLFSNQKKEELSIIQAYDKFIKKQGYLRVARRILALFKIKAYKHFDPNPVNRKRGGMFTPIKTYLKEYNDQIDWDKLTFYRDMETRKYHVKDARTYMGEDGRYRVTPLFYSGKGCAVTCPHCDGIHHHGWMPGDVVPDCGGNVKNYEIIPLQGDEYDNLRKETANEKN